MRIKAQTVSTRPLIFHGLRTRLEGRRIKREGGREGGRDGRREEGREEVEGMRIKE